MLLQPFQTTKENARTRELILIIMNVAQSNGSRDQLIKQLDKKIISIPKEQRQAALTEPLQNNLPRTQEGNFLISPVQAIFAFDDIGLLNHVMTHYLTFSDLSLLKEPIIPVAIKNYAQKCTLRLIELGHDLS